MHVELKKVVRVRSLGEDSELREDEAHGVTREGHLIKEIRSTGKPLLVDRQPLQPNNAWIRR